MTMQRYRWQGWTRWYGWALLGLGCSTALARGHYQEQRPEGVPGQFDYYLLSLSWSPTYCLTHPYDRMQCAGKGYGFVLHGLWPQYDSGGYPSYCAASSLSEAAQALGQTLYPSPKLLQHEWAEHGSCSGMDALAYFRTADRATAAVRIPTVFEAPRNTLVMTGDEITAAFRAANPTLPDDALAVACSRGQLSEVRICLTRSLQIRTCGRGLRSNCTAYPLQIRSAR
jgi:ribonuclease T2